MAFNEVGRHLPVLRRFARALSGSLAVGDRLVAATLQALVEGRIELDAKRDARTALFAAFCLAHKDHLPPPEETPVSADEPLEARLALLDPPTRAVFLLVAMEQFPGQEVADMLDLSTAEVEARVEAAGRLLAFPGDAVPEPVEPAVTERNRTHESRSSAPRHDAGHDRSEARHAAQTGTWPFRHPEPQRNK